MLRQLLCDRLKVKLCRAYPEALLYLEGSTFRRLSKGSAFSAMRGPSGWLPRCDCPPDGCLASTYLSGFARRYARVNREKSSFKATPASVKHQARGADDIE